MSPLGQISEIDSEEDQESLALLRSLMDEFVVSTEETMVRMAKNKATWETS